MIEAAIVWTLVLSPALLGLACLAMEYRDEHTPTK
jgi:hypothetical protein